MLVMACLIMSIEYNKIYTTNEAQASLRISKSTMKRLLKKGIIRANKIGGQYRILGKELLRLVSPKIERKTVFAYRGIKKKIKETTRGW